jgi:hypothetical protein
VARLNPRLKPLRGGEVSSSSHSELVFAFTIKAPSAASWSTHQPLVRTGPVLGRRCGFHIRRYSGGAPNARHGPALTTRPGGLGRRRDRGRAGVRPRASNSVTSAPSQNSVSRPVAVACGTSFLCRGRVSWSMLRVGGPTASLEAFKCRSLRPKAWRLPLARDCDACHTISEALGPSKLTRVDTWRLCCESVTRSPAISRFSLPGALCAYLAALVGI